MHRIKELVYKANWTEEIKPTPNLFKPERSTNHFPAIEASTRRSIRIPTVISVTAFAPASVIDLRSRRTHRPIRHALRLVPFAPIAPLAPITCGVYQLLLGPNDVALRIVPSTGSVIAAGIALLIAEFVGNRYSETDTNNISNAYSAFYADGLRPRLAGLRLIEEGC